MRLPTGRAGKTKLNDKISVFSNNTDLFESAIDVERKKSETNERLQDMKNNIFSACQKS